MAVPPHDMPRLQEAGRELSVATIAFHRKVATRLGLNDTDMKCLDILMSSGAMTAGELGRKAGYTSGAVTGIINRLATGGWVVKRSDAEDLRRVLVDPVRAEVMARMTPLVLPMVQRVDELNASYTAADQEVIYDYICRATAALWAALEDISQNPQST